MAGRRWREVFGVLYCREDSSVRVLVAPVVAVPRHGQLPEGGEDRGRHVRGGVQSSEPGDRRGGGAEEDPPGHVSAGGGQALFVLGSL